MVRHCENKQPVLLNGADERISELPQNALPDTGSNLGSGFGELCDAVFSPPNFGEEASPQSGRLQFEVTDLTE